MGLHLFARAASRRPVDEVQGPAGASAAVRESRRQDAGRSPRCSPESRPANGENSVQRPCFTFAFATHSDVCSSYSRSPTFSTTNTAKVNAQGSEWYFMKRDKLISNHEAECYIHVHISTLLHICKYHTHHIPVSFKREASLPPYPLECVAVRSPPVTHTRT